MTTKITTDNIQPNTVVTYAEWSDNLLPKVGNVSIANSSYTVLDDTAVNVGGGYIVVTGGGFQDGATVLISGTQATAVSYVNSSTLHVQVPAKSAATYNLYVVNPDGGTAIGPNKLTYSGVPTWVTVNTLDNWQVDVAANVTFDATGAVSYSNTTALPAGTELLSNGYFYGTVTGIESETTYNFTIRATDAENQDSDKSFSLTVLTILPRTFSISPAVSGLTTWDLDTDGPLDLTSAGTWTITPTSDINTCNIQVWGAAGGGVSSPWGAGGYMAADFILTGSTSYVAIVGSAGDGLTGGTPGGANATAAPATGSGGLSGIFTNSYSQANSLIIGGGGGGRGSPSLVGGRGGGTNGSSGGSANFNGTLIVAGGAGNQVAGGTSPATYPYQVAGNSGSALNGGAGKSNTGWASGAGGGGYYGGAGGGGVNPGAVSSGDRGGGGGGGGSGYIHPSGTNATGQIALGLGTGRILIT